MISVYVATLAASAAGLAAIVATTARRFIIARDLPTGWHTR